MDGFADVGCITAHFDGQADFANQIAAVGADDTAADNTACFGIKNQFGKAIVAAVGNRTSGSSPWEGGFGDFAA